MMRASVRESVNGVSSMAHSLRRSDAYPALKTMTRGVARPAWNCTREIGRTR